IGWLGRGQHLLPELKMQGIGEFLASLASSGNGAAQGGGILGAIGEAQAMFSRMGALFETVSRQQQEILLRLELIEQSQSRIEHRLGGGNDSWEPESGVAL